MPPNGSCWATTQSSAGPHDRPEPLHEREVAADQPVVPDADREVGRHVDLAAVVLDLAADDLHRPRAVRRAACVGTQA